MRRGICRFRFEAGLVLALLVFGGTARAATLASNDTGFGSNCDCSHEYSLFYGPGDFAPPTIVLGDGLAVFSLSDVIGTTVVVNASNDPDFAAFEAAMTDGLAPAPDVFGFQVIGIQNVGGGFGGSGTTAGGVGECIIFINAGAGGTCVGTTDLAGYDIESVSFELTNVAPFSTMGVQTSVTITIEGTLIPEPSTGLLVAIGLTCLAARRRSVELS